MNPPAVAAQTDQAVRPKPMSKKKQMQMAREEARRLTARVHEEREQLLCVSGRAEDLVSNWPTAFQEMAERIQREGENSVPDRDRNLIADGVPRGEFTSRDGVSSAQSFLVGSLLAPGKAGRK